MQLGRKNCFTEMDLRTSRLSSLIITFIVLVSEPHAYNFTFIPEANTSCYKFWTLDLLATETEMLNLRDVFCSGL